jgi:hypothetical protein
LFTSHFVKSTGLSEQTIKETLQILGDGEKPLLKIVASSTRKTTSENAYEINDEYMTSPG